MKIYIPNITNDDRVGGGWTFLRNFKKGMSAMCQFVDRWQDCDIFFIVGITITDPAEVHEAHKAGKKIIMRVDNVPKKSRNKRSTPHERIKEFADMCELVIYQSQWAKEYCYPLAGNGMVIYNGCDTDIYYSAKQKPENPVYLFAYHGKNEMKQFWFAHLYFQYFYRANNNAVFKFIYDFGRDYDELAKSNFDFWNGEKYEHIPLIQDAEDMADLMRECTHLIYPSIADASPNIVTEARACGLEIVGESDYAFSGTKELMDIEDISLDRMIDEYYGAFQLVLNMQN